MPRSEVRDTAALLRAAFGERSFTTGEAAECGVPIHRLKSAVRAGAVVRLRRGVLRVEEATRPVDGLAPLILARIADRVAALHEREVPAAIGAVAAVKMWEIPTWQVADPAIPTLFVPRSSLVRRGVQGGVRIIPRDLDPGRVVVGPCGLPMTDPLLSAVHVGAHSDLNLVGRLIVIHGGLRRQLEWERGGLERLDGRVLADLTADPTCRQSVLEDARRLTEASEVRGKRRVVEALALADPRIETALESLSWAQFFLAGLPRPTPQARVRGASGVLWRVDFLFGERVIGECDGAVKYLAGQSLWEEKRRQSDLEAAGYIVVRWTWEEIMRRPHVVMARIALAMTRAA